RLVPNRGLVYLDLYGKSMHFQRVIHHVPLIRGRFTVERKRSVGRTEIALAIAVPSRLQF
ncbi:MAG: hypothetical protein ACE5NA_10820, partial [Nitrospiraceae bacterium]